MYRKLDFDREHLARALCCLGNVALEKGDLPLARTQYVESLRAAREGLAIGRVAAALEALGGLALLQQQLPRAMTLLSAASACRERNGQPLPDDKQAVIAARLSSATSGLSPETQATAWAKGQHLSLEEAVAYALHEPVLSEFPSLLQVQATSRTSLRASLMDTGRVRSHTGDIGGRQDLA
jgi:hypothetical protein